MCHDWKSNNKINRIHERGLGLLIRDTGIKVETLLGNSNSVPVHQKNLQVLMIEIHKSVNGLNPRFMKDIFVERKLPYNLRTSKSIILPHAKTSSFATKKKDLATSQRMKRSELKINNLLLLLLCTPKYARRNFF